MKKAVWITALLPLIITGVVLRFMPDKVPTHYDISGKIDGRGTKYVYLILPAAVIGITLLFGAISRSVRKKAAASGEEKKTAEAVSNAKVFDVISICTAVMTGVIQCFMLRSACIASSAGADNMEEGSAGMMVMSALMGLMFIVIGNFLPKTKLNGAVGLRTSSSMYNDNTWRRSNSFAGKAFVITGLLTFVTSLFAPPIGSVVMMLVYLTACTVVSCVYAKKVCDEERAASISAE